MHRSIFVSSTFQDMNLERDVIHTRIIPVVNAIAKRSGDSVSVCDLRWGINTSDMDEIESSKKVLKTCLNEIDRCRPYMIVLLGYRYGWIPDNGLILQTVREKMNFSLETPDISVTELEIEYVALSNSLDIERTLFYFREIDGMYDSIYDAESEIHRKKLELLKSKIISLPNARIKTYHVNMQAQEKCLKNFSEMVCNDLISLMQEEWKKNEALDQFAIDQNNQWDYLLEKSSQFLARKEQLNKIICKVTDEGHNLLIHGKTGSGKSTLMSRMGKVLSDNGIDIVPIYCGYTDLTTSGFDLLKYIIYETERRLSIEHFIDYQVSDALDRGEWISRLKQIIKRYGCSNNPRIVFLIDGIDQLTKDEITENYSFIPENKYSNITFVVSMVTLDKMPFKQQILIDDLTESEQREVITGILAGKRRELSESVIEKMLRLPNSKLPLYLSLIVQRLIMMDNDDFQKVYHLGKGIEGINKYHLKIINECPESLSDLSVYVLGRASTQVGGEPVKLMGYYLAFSRYGLRFSDLEMLVNALKDQSGTRAILTMADTAAFLQYSDSFFFIRGDGRIDFTHKCFREGLRDSLADNKLAFNRVIASWLEHLPDDDAIRNSELGWHLIQGDAIGHLAYLVMREAQNRPLRNAMAKELAIISLEDNGHRLINVINEISDEPFFMDFSSFITMDVFFKLPNNNLGLEIRKRLVMSLLTIEHAKENDNFNYGLQWDISVQYERLSLIEREFETKEHITKSKKYAEQCLKIRKALLEILQLVKNKKLQRSFILFDLETSGKRITSPMTLEQANSCVESYYLENLRGICVANELIAKSLKNDYPKTAKESIAYFEKSLSIRNEIFNTDKDFSFLMNDEASELATIHLEIAKAFQSLLDSDSLIKAENHILEAISICEKAYKEAPTGEHTHSLSESYRLMAAFLFEYCKNRNEEAINYAEKCLPLMETLFLKKQSVSYQFELALVYSMLGDLYGVKEGVDWREASHRFYEKMNALSRGIIIKDDSIISKKLAVLGELDEAISSENLKIEEIQDYFKTAYSVAKQIFLDAKAYQNYEWLADVFKSLIQVIEKFGFSETTEGKRAIIEIQCASLEWKLQIDNLALKEIKECIIEYNQLGEDIMELALPDDARWPSEWIDILKCLEISEDCLNTMPAKRAYDISKKSLNLSRAVYKKESNLANEDFLAVSLSKFAHHCMNIDLSEFSSINKELMGLASKLRAKTGNSKYFIMMFQAEMGNHLLEGDFTEFLDSFTSSHKKPKRDTPKVHEKVTEKELRDAARSVINEIREKKND